MVIAHTVVFKSDWTMENLENVAAVANKRGDNPEIALIGAKGRGLIATACELCGNLCRAVSGAATWQVPVKIINVPAWALNAISERGEISYDDDDECCLCGDCAAQD